VCWFESSPGHKAFSAKQRGLFCLGVVKACIDKIELEIIYYMLSNHGQTEKPSDTEWSEGLG
jgi:hypothetical protein